MKEKFTISIISQLFLKIFSIISTYFFVLYLDVELIGIWALLNSVISLGFIFTDLGLVIIHYQYSEKKDFDDYFGTFFLMKCFLMVINIGVSLSLITMIGLWSSIYINILLLLLCTNVITSLLNIFIIHLRAKLKVIKVEISVFIITVCQNIAQLYIALNIEYIADPLLWLSFAMVIFSILYVILIFIISKNDFKLSKPKKSYMISYLKDIKPLAIFSILSIITANLGNVLLDYSFDHETLAYFYLVNGYILPILGIISTSMISICLPLFSQAFASNDISSIEKTVHKIEKYSSILILSIIIVVFLVGELIFSLILPTYMNSLPILYVLLFFVYLGTISRNYGLVLISNKMQKLSANLSIFNTTLKLILIVLLIPNNLFGFKMLGFGSFGYAFAILIPGIITAFHIRYFVKKKCGIKPQKQIIIHLILAFFSFLIVFFLKTYIFEELILNQYFLIIILIILSIGIFIGCLFIFKIIKKDDIIFLLQLLKLKNYTKSMKEEFTNF